MRGVTLLLAVFALAASEAGAMAMDETDLMVGMKTLPLLNNKLSGNIKIAVIFDPGQDSSRQEAESVVGLISSGLTLPGDLSASGVLVPVNQLDKMAGSKIAIVTPNLTSYYNAISESAALDHILTISTDLTCVRTDKCILGVVSKPRVEIYYSKAAADNAKVTFEQAFTMLAKSANN